MSKASGKSYADLEIDISGARCEHLIAVVLPETEHKTTAIISFKCIYLSPIYTHTSMVKEPYGILEIFGAYTLAALMRASHVAGKVAE